MVAHRRLPHLRLASDGLSWKSEAAAHAAGESWPHRCRFVVANFGLEDITAEAGATEVWPGSHADMSVVFNDASSDARRGTEHLEKFFTEQVARRRMHSPPIPMTCPAGSVVLRDNRCWHCGDHNATDRPRHMVGLAYLAADRWSGQGTGEMVFGPGCRAVLDAAGGSRCQREPFIVFADAADADAADADGEGGADSRQLIEGHGDWQMPLPTLERVRRAFAQAPWANVHNWAVAMAERVLTSRTSRIARL
eukprot:COSAG01_NODE_4914_length_4629_cov_110.104636_2_plen_251_part_00